MDLKVALKLIHTIIPKENYNEYATVMFKYLGENSDIPAPNLGTNSQIMDWITGVYKKKHKAIITQFSQGNRYAVLVRREESSNWIWYSGVYKIMRGKERYRFMWKNVYYTGVDNLGSNTAILLSRLGMICIGVGDHTRCIKNEEGFNVYI